MPLFLAILALGILIFVHELGHFLAAKLFGIYVERFSLGFGPKVVGIKWGETEYLLSSVPLGGYVKMLGEDGEEPIPPELEKRSFSHKPYWQRIIVVLAGPAANVIFAWALIYCTQVAGVPVLKPEIGKVLPNSPAEEAGLKPKDVIIAIDGKSVTSWSEMAKIIHSKPNREITLSVKRNGKIIEIKVKTEGKVQTDPSGRKRTIGLIGIYPSGSTVVKRLNPIIALGESLKETYRMAYITVKGLVMLIQRKISVKSLGGPILIVQMASKQAQNGFLQFLIFTALISVNLGIINLLPIPILDGGHVVLFSIEAIRRRPLSRKSREIAQQIGLAIIVFIMLIAMYNDLTRLLVQRGK